MNNTEWVHAAGQDSQASFNASWCSLLKSAQLTEEEISVGCRSFKQETNWKCVELVLMLGIENLWSALS